MAFQTGLEGKPWYVGTLVGLAVAIAVFVLCHVVFFKDMGVQIQNQEARLAELQARIQEGRAASRQLPEFRERVRRLELDLDRLLRILPSRRNTADLLRRIRDLTQQGDFELQRFRPGGFVDREFYAEWPIAINLQGGYHELALFFDRVSRFSRIINIQDLNITAANQRDASIQATFNLVTFVYLGDEAAEEEAGGGVAP